MAQEYKKRILVVNEAHFLSTGFSNYMRDIITRLYNTAKYDIAELGTYCRPSDPRIRNVKWRFYAGMPEEGDKVGQEKYNKLYPQWGRMSPLGQFGANILDEVLLDFQPDYVLNIMDAWMQSPVFDTPLRKMYRLISMPCLDSTPQREEWMRMYESADYLLGYSDFAINILNEQSPKIKTAGARKLLPMPARPGVDMKTFRPLNKVELREKWHIQPDVPVVLSCMRNQARKLFCEILDSFAKYKKDNPNDPVAQKAVYLITSNSKCITRSTTN